MTNNFEKYYNINEEISVLNSNLEYFSNPANHNPNRFDAAKEIKKTTKRIVELNKELVEIKLAIYNEKEWARQDSLYAS